VLTTYYTGEGFKPSCTSYSVYTTDFQRRNSPQNKNGEKVRPVGQ